MEYRNGMVNVSPIGRNATIEERNEFEKYDKGFLLTVYVYFLLLSAALVMRILNANVFLHIKIEFEMMISSNSNRFIAHSSGFFWVSGSFLRRKKNVSKKKT